MYIIKNALRSIVRSTGRTVIICLIVLAISTASCVALSIQQAAQTARVNGSKSLVIRGHIKADRKYVMDTLQAANENADPTDMQSVREALQSISGLGLDEMLTYAGAESVQDFYYYSMVSLSGDNDLKPLNQDDHSSIEAAISNALPTTQTTQTTQAAPSAPSAPSGPTAPGDGPGGGPGAGPNSFGSVEDIMASINFGGDFVLYGYSSDLAMEDFRDGTCYITSGKMFEEGTSEYVCIMNEELAAYNDLHIGDKISLSNPGMRSERFLFTIVGLFKNNADLTVQTSDDPANHILTSYAVVHDIAEKSAAYRDPSSVESAVESQSGLLVEQLLTDDGALVVNGQPSADDAEAGESENALSESVVGTYVFDSIESFDAFEAQAKALGLSSNYTVTSSDVAAYEASLVPLENLSSYANMFLYIILGIGAVILIGVNVFNIRERKYEIGALTAMGMKKSKVALQFITELTVVTFIGIILGSALGAALSTPVANTLLASQVAYEESNSQALSSNFGREVSDPSAKPHGGDVEGEVEYVSSVSFSFDTTVVYQMIVIGALLALVSSAAAITFILRYNPLEILAERD